MLSKIKRFCLPAYLLFVSSENIICIFRWMVEYVRVEQLRCPGFSFSKPPKLLFSDYKLCQKVDTCIPRVPVNSLSNAVTRNKAVLLGGTKLSQLSWRSIPFQPSTAQKLIQSINREFFQAIHFIVLKKTKGLRNKNKMALASQSGMDVLLSVSPVSSLFYNDWFMSSNMRAIRLCTRHDALRHMLSRILQ